MSDDIPMTILVVDDSSMARKMIRQELVDSGYSVIEAEDGFSALTKAVGSPTPDLITLDVEMPKMNGFETCKKLREDRFAKHFTNCKDNMIPVVFVTSLDSLEARSKGFQLGAIDFITKPFAKGEIAGAVDKILRPENLLMGATALVVDDSSLVRNIVTSTLEQQGVRVLEAVDGRHAFETAKKHRAEIDMVVTDFNMPEMNGDELCHLLRRELEMTQVPIIFLTARTEKEIILDIFRAGATDYIVKPFVQEEVLARIKVHLEVRKLLKQYMDEVEFRKETEIELRRVNTILKDQAIKDGLTGLHNHRHFQEMLKINFSLTQRHDMDLSCILIDLDHFKEVNDNHGHPFGDFVLKGFSAILKDLARETDVVARYGGEEFVLLLPNTNLDGAIIFAERVRAKTADHLYNDGLNSRHVTVSLGVSSYQEHMPEDQAEMLAFADKALYSAKDGGRNRAIPFSKTNDKV